MLCCIAYVPGIAFYVMARREYKAETVMTGAEKALAAFIVIVAAAAITLLATGVFTI